MIKDLETSELTEAKAINASAIEAIKPDMSDVTVNNSVELADVITAIEKTSNKELGVLASIEKSLSRKAFDVESAVIHQPSIPVQNIDDAIQSVKATSKTIVPPEKTAVEKSNKEPLIVVTQSKSKDVSESEINTVKEQVSTTTERPVSVSKTNNEEVQQTSIPEAVSSNSIASSKTENASTIESIVKGMDGRYRNEKGSFASKAQIKEFEKSNKPDSEDKDKIANLENKSLLIKIKDSIVDSAKSDDGESLIGKSVFGSVYDIAQEAKGLYSETVDLKEKAVEVLSSNSQNDSGNKNKTEEVQAINSKGAVTVTNTDANETKSEVESTDTQVSTSAEAFKNDSANINNAQDSKSSNARYTKISQVNTGSLNANAPNDLNAVPVDIKSVNEQLLTESKDHTTSLRGILESTKYNSANKNNNVSVSDKFRSFFTKDKSSKVNKEQLNTEKNEDIKKETKQDSSKFSIKNIKEKAFASVSSRVQSVKDKYSDVKTKLTPFKSATNDEVKDKKSSFIDKAKEKISSYFKSDGSTVSNSTNNKASDNKTESISSNKQVEKQSKSAVKGNTQNKGNIEDQILAEIQNQSDVLSDILDETKANSSGAGGSIIDDVLGAAGGGSKGGKGNKGAKKQGRFSKAIDKLKSKSPRFAKVANAGGNVAAKAASLVSSAGSSALKVVSKVAAPLTAVLAGYSKHQELKSDTSLTDTQKNTITGATGGGALAGAMGGAAAGAAIGSVVPLVGTAIGGLIGGALGAWFGAEGGTVVGEMVASQLDSPEDIASQNTDKTKEVQSPSERHNAINASSSELVEIKQTEKALSTTNTIQSSIASTQTPISAISQSAASPVQSIDAMKVKQNQGNKQQVNKRIPASKSAVSNKNTSDTKLINAINNLTKKVTAQDKNPSAVRPHVPMTFDDTHLKMISLDLE